MSGIDYAYMAPEQLRNVLASRINWKLRHGVQLTEDERKCYVLYANEDIEREQAKVERSMKRIERLKASQREAAQFMIDEAVAELAPVDEGRE